MGEAQRRKHSDPNFGRFPKKAPFRGLVVSPPIEIEGTRLLARSSNLDPQELRFALLFWDQLVWPSSRAIHFASGPDEVFLESAKILTRPDYTINGDGAQGIAKGQIQAFLDLECAEPGVWAMAQGENSFLWKDGFADEGSGVLVELHRAIPIPKHDVPLAEVLEFRVRRRDELLLLRYHLETFVTEIETAVDKPAALKNRAAEIDQACANLLQVGKEWQFPVYLSNIKTSFSLSPTKFLPAVAGGWALGESYGLHAASAVAAFAGAASTIEIKSDLGLRSLKRPKSPFRYACLTHQELS
ncbi:DUF6236 family protein [Polaromonas glacialis]|uniref:DUF6236 family protein n=1 Tax=Polaromonas glacialis TaxID=866564 RepID=UPI0012EC5951|nr:DUF6236 family protein [Polaromonas glacialis]